ncbi:hypothetical protein A0J61_11289 [Choanephora cucurbitarum]|uniref:Endonuclease/exonuclease/phosphatase domain-containing protein n=1 Tax=Choanephora cucurbitarum TaxID=101091 RepID=A0A1C7MUZ1_9FUNG|nr:hypothetical protein A0J61_11289 [Choanephora cucurbitarum]
MSVSTITIATLNCRGLRETHNPSSSRSFIRYLRSLNIDILCLQETHTIDTTIQAEFDLLFNTTSSLWTTNCGDLNINPMQKSNITDVWLELLDLRFRDCFGQTFQPTFTSTTGSRTRIDFIFSSADHHLSITFTAQEFLSSAWTDHDLLAATFRPILESNGPGLWKANSFLANLPSFRHGLIQHIEAFLNSQNVQDGKYPDTPQSFCDTLKAEAKPYTKSYQLETNLWRKKTLKKYQSKRNRILREYKNTTILSSLLPTLEAMIGSFQDEIAHVNALKTGKFWREKGERSAGLLKHLASSRTMQRTISSLYDTSTEQLVTTVLSCAGGSTFTRSALATTPETPTYHSPIG